LVFLHIEGEGMRTNIEIDDKLMAKAMKASGASTKKAVVEEALRLLVRIRGQARIRELRGKIKWEGDLDTMRLGRNAG
jgi:Arc/MetJ family transcription regulator